MFKRENKSLILSSVSGKKSVSELSAGRRTPFYLYDLDGIRDRAKQFKSVLPSGSHIHFAMKANHNSHVLRVLKEEGFGVDVVSGGEIRRAIDCGFKPNQVVFSGVGKSHTELKYAIGLGVKQINCESYPEIERVIQISRELNKKPRIAVRINPDVTAETHPYIQTGFRENKFGVILSELSQILDLCQKNSNHCDLRGVTLHIGSQIRETEPFVQAAQKGLQVLSDMKSKGFSGDVFDLGGGLGMDYHSSDLIGDEEGMKKYGNNISQAVQGFKGDLLFEPGRILVARFGLLVTQLEYVKETPYKKFLIVNTGMHHLMRPALYEAFHRIEPLELSEGNANVYDVVGPICESSDTLGFDRVFTGKMSEGDLLGIFDVGAYGYVMASHYNLHDMPEEVCVENGKVL